MCQGFGVGCFRGLHDGEADSEAGGGREEVGVNVEGSPGDSGVSAWGGTPQAWDAVTSAPRRQAGEPWRGRARAPQHPGILPLPGTRPSGHLHTQAWICAAAPCQYLAS